MRVILGAGHRIAHIRCSRAVVVTAAGDDVRCEVFMRDLQAVVDDRHHDAGTAVRKRRPRCDRAGVLADHATTLSGIAQKPLTCEQGVGPGALGWCGGAVLECTVCAVQIGADRGDRRLGDLDRRAAPYASTACTTASGATTGSWRVVRTAAAPATGQQKEAGDRHGDAEAPGGGRTPAEQGAGPTRMEQLSVSVVRCGQGSGGSRCRVMAGHGSAVSLSRLLSVVGRRGQAELSG